MELEQGVSFNLNIARVHRGRQSLRPCLESLSATFLHRRDDLSRQRSVRSRC